MHVELYLLYQQKVNQPKLIGIYLLKRNLNKHTGMVFTTKPHLPLPPRAPFGRLLSTLAIALPLGARICMAVTPTATVRLTATRLGACVEIRNFRAFMLRIFD